MNVQNIEDAILKVFESCNAERVRTYLSKRNINEDIKMGVLVQEQIIGKYSGVAFTREPVTFEDKVVIEYVEGPAWDLVSGKVSPKREILDQPKGMFADLWNICKDIEQFFGTPQDIEWILSDKFYIVQSRPITTEKKITKDIPEKGIVLKGTPASPGVYKGKIQYIYDDLPVKEALKIFEKGNILVTSFLYPEYTPVLSKAGAIIAEVNTITSHVAIVAREFEIPCVVGIDLKRLSMLVHEFDEVIVDGNSGKIVIPNPRSEKIFYAKRGEHRNPFGEPDKKFLNILKEIGESVEKRDVVLFEKTVQKAIDEIINSAEKGDPLTGARYTGLCRYLQDEVPKIIKNVYPKSDLLKKFIYVDKHKSYRDDIEHIYFVLRERIQSLDYLKINGKNIMEIAYKLLEQEE